MFPLCQSVNSQRVKTNECVCRDTCGRRVFYPNKIAKHESVSWEEKVLIHDLTYIWDWLASLLRMGEKKDTEVVLPAELFHLTYPYCYLITLFYTTGVLSYCIWLVKSYWLSCNIFQISHCLSRPPLLPANQATCPSRIFMTSPLVFKLWLRDIIWEAV